jgi:farnesyl diphosphate synthase
LGKTAGKDAAQNKTTYVSLLGLAASKTLLTELSVKMQASLAPLDARAEGLRALAEIVVARVS